jgi:hypothetical protein
VFDPFNLIEFDPFNMVIGAWLAIGLLTWAVHDLQQSVKRLKVEVAGLLAARDREYHWPINGGGDGLPHKTP